MKVHEKNNFTRENFETMTELLQSKKLPRKYKKSILSLLSAYCKGLYCSECRGSVRISSTGGACMWNNDMLISLPSNDGPLEGYPADCPIRKLIK